MTGRSSVRRGVNWQRACAAEAREQWPHADHSGTGPSTAHRRQGDISGVGDRIFECTVRPMADLAEKMRQAEGDALRLGFAEYYVWKKAVGEDPRRSWLITRAGVLLPLLARLDRLEAWEAEHAAGAEDAYARGYRDGLADKNGARA